MAAREPASREGKRRLSETAGFSRLVGVKTFTGSVQVATTVTKLFVFSTMGTGVEGRIQSFGYVWGAGDYQTSPVSLVTWDAQALTPGTATPMASGCVVYMPPFVIPCPANGFVYQSGTGAPLKPGEGVGLQIKNNEATSFFASGWITLEFWSPEDRADADRECQDACGPSPAPWARNGRVLTTGRPQ